MCSSSCHHIVGDLKPHVRVRATDLHALYGVGQRTGSVDEVSVFHVFRHSLQKAQRLIEDDGHRDLRQFLRERKQTPVQAHSSCACDIFHLGRNPFGCFGVG